GEDILVDVEDPIVGYEAANLRLLAEAEDVGLHAKMLEAPHSSGEPDAGLHFIEDQQHVVFITELPHSPEELGAEMVVAALSLDRLHDERGDFVLALAKESLRLIEGRFLAPLCVGERLRRRWEVDLRVVDPRPVELREVLRLARICGVGQRKAVSGTAVERLA